MPALMPVSRRSSVRFVLGFFSGIAIGMTLCIILANNWNWVITDTRVSSDGNNLILSEYDDEWKQELQNRQDNMLPLKKYGDFRPQDPNHGNLQDLQEHHGNIFKIILFIKIKQLDKFSILTKLSALSILLL